MSTQSSLHTCTKWHRVGGGGGGQPPPFEKHGQGSEHTGFLQPLNTLLFLFCIVLAVRNSGGGWGGRSPPPHLQDMDDDQNTYIFLHPSDGFVLQCAL